MDNRLGIITKLYYHHPCVVANAIANPNCIVDMDSTQLVLSVNKVFDEVHFCYDIGETGTTVTINNEHKSIYDEMMTQGDGISIVNKSVLEELTIEEQWVQNHCSDERRTALYCQYILTIHINLYNIVSKRNSLAYYLMFNPLNVKTKKLPGKMFISYLFYKLKAIACQIKNGSDIGELVKWILIIQT